jgi:hypothetical protein
VLVYYSLPCFGLQSILDLVCTSSIEDLAEAWPLLRPTINNIVSIRRAVVFPPILCRTQMQLP